MKKTALLGVLALAAASGFGPAQAEDKVVEMKFAHWLPTGHPMHPSAVAWAEDIEKASGNTIKITIYPAQQLGKAFDHYNMARDGIADIAHYNPGYEPGRFPIWGAMEMPFVVSNAKEGTAAYDSWYRKYADREMKDVHFCLAFAHDPGTWHTTKKKIVVPADVVGMKIRPSGSTIASWITALGGTNVQSSAAEARDILEKGVADGTTLPWGSVVLFGIDKVTHYHMDAALYVAVQAFGFNKNTYESLSPAQKKVIDDHCTTEWAQKIATPWADMERGGLAKIKAEEGQEIYPITPEQLELWRQSAEPLQIGWANAVTKAGYNAREVRDELKAALAKYNSAY